MKTFRQFNQILEGKYSDEHAFRKQWNYFIKDSNPDADRIRDLLSKGEVEDAKSEMQRIVSDAQDEDDHPLHFKQANRGFTVYGLVGFVDDGRIFGSPAIFIISGACPPPAPSV